MNRLRHQRIVADVAVSPFLFARRHRLQTMLEISWKSIFEEPNEELKYIKKILKCTVMYIVFSNSSLQTMFPVSLLAALIISFKRNCGIFGCVVTSFVVLARA
jgi:hypothetical protein